MKAHITHNLDMATPALRQDQKLVDTLHAMRDWFFDQHAAACIDNPASDLEMLIMWDGDHRPIGFPSKSVIEAVEPSSTRDFGRRLSAFLICVENRGVGQLCRIRRVFRANRTTPEDQELHDTLCWR